MQDTRGKNLKFTDYIKTYNDQSVRKEKRTLSTRKLNYDGEENNFGASKGWQSSNVRCHFQSVQKMRQSSVECEDACKEKCIYEEKSDASPTLPNRTPFKSLTNNQTAELFNTTKSLRQSIKKLRSYGLLKTPTHNVQNVAKPLEFNDDDDLVPDNSDSTSCDSEEELDEQNMEFEEAVSSSKEELARKTAMKNASSAITMNDPEEQAFIQKVRKDIAKTNSFLNSQKSSLKVYKGVERMYEKFNKLYPNLKNPRQNDRQNSNEALNLSVMQPLAKCLPVSSDIVDLSQEPVDLSRKQTDCQSKDRKDGKVVASHKIAVVKPNHGPKTPKNIALHRAMVDTPSLVKSLKKRLTGRF